MITSPVDSIAVHVESTIIFSVRVCVCVCGLVSVSDRHVVTLVCVYCDIVSQPAHYVLL